PPCMAMGEAAGTAAAMALDSGGLVRAVDVSKLQKKLRAQGADPGDVPSANATLLAQRGPEGPILPERGARGASEREPSAVAQRGARSDEPSAEEARGTDGRASEH
ncbi:MAG TPA: FAD-dependent oxidoreductase, partial [Vicinamibacteria bacterium]|nr:FAD-dependent oxidoreductase [Vicinamibacteria bacterium]